ncbi:hypothetical protein BMR1_01G01395 [Babesia microti strain RI]|uniref:Uncharacterized protein n=1 Tax=Babesia microti (strain RI) TaxID=1133968 RepID=I7J5C3_BABMR|nr:hypothetical protein BMR1_01G01395 [Babesia microti strain RI]CCF72742.1 hypothetical protein BMR1_01G01395 [Babesia microti strain RI]|eukprot:XP_012647351.1 hypothetical protein BMR1_01G01395 [Babesia microti strain RI]
MNWSFVTNLDARKNAFLSIILSASTIYNTADQVIVLLDRSIADDSIFAISQFINSSLQDKTNWINSISLVDLLESLLDQSLAKEFLNECLLDRDKFIKVLSRIKLKFIYVMEDTIEQITTCLTNISTVSNIKLVVLDQLSRLLFGTEGKFPQFISKYALITSLVQNKASNTLILESIRTLDNEYRRRIVGFLTSRSDSTCIIQECKRH